MELITYEMLPHLPKMTELLGDFASLLYASTCALLTNKAIDQQRAYSGNLIFRLTKPH